VYGRAVRRLALLLGLLVLGGCRPRDEGLTLVEAPSVAPADIDARPLGLLPRGALVLGRLEGRALFGSPLASATGTLVRRVLPLGRESNFDAARDVERVHGAFYAMQGADFCAVLQGSFDVASIERAAEARATTSTGAPLVRTRYAGRTLYTAGNLGFVVLTPRTLLSGDETGLRRALDRLRSGKLEVELPGWMTATLAEPKAAFAVVGDLERNGVTRAAADHARFVDGLSTLRILGNFEPPGVHVVGALGYRGPDEATKARLSLEEFQQMSALASIFTAFAGVIPPRLDVTMNGRELAFASAVDTGFLQVVLATASAAIRPSNAGW